MFWLHVFLCTHVCSAIKFPRIGVIGVCEHQIWIPCKGNQFVTGKPLELKRNEYVFACMSYAGAYRSQKSLGYLELELQLVASCHLGAGNWTCSCSKYFLSTDPWLQPPYVDQSLCITYLPWFLWPLVFSNAGKCWWRLQWSEGWRGRDLPPRSLIVVGRLLLTGCWPNLRTLV